MKMKKSVKKQIAAQQKKAEGADTVIREMQSKKFFSRLFNRLHSYIYGESKGYFMEPRYFGFFDDRADGTSLFVDLWLSDDFGFGFEVKNRLGDQRVVDLNSISSFEGLIESKFIPHADPCINESLANKFYRKNVKRKFERAMIDFGACDECDVKKNFKRLESIYSEFNKSVYINNDTNEALFCLHVDWS